MKNILKYKTILIGIVLFIVSAANLKSQSDIKVKPGIDVLSEHDYDSVAGLKISILTNHTGRSSTGELSAEMLLRSDKCKLLSILTPEHGFWATVPAGEHVGNQELFGLPVYSLYGDNRRPTRSQLSDIDAVVVDFQDIGVRSYTYISTMYKVMDACAEYGVRVIVLDRPNPLSGEVVDGNTVEPGNESFIGIAPIAYVHGCTIGELAEMFNEEGWLPKDEDGVPRKCKLTVIKMQGWQRSMRWEDTGLMWFPTSPNIPDPNSARGAAMLGLFGELGLASMGIGTSMPFRYFGNPGFDAEEVLKHFLEDSHPGLYLAEAKFKQGSAKSAECDGFLLLFPKSADFKPFTEGVKLVLALRAVKPGLISSANTGEKAEQMFNKAFGSKELLGALKKKAGDKYILKLAVKGLDEFLTIRSKYLLY